MFVSYAGGVHLLGTCPFALLLCPLKAPIIPFLMRVLLKPHYEVHYELLAAVQVHS